MLIVCRVPIGMCLRLVFTLFMRWNSLHFSILFLIFLLALWWSCFKYVWTYDCLWLSMQKYLRTIFPLILLLYSCSCSWILLLLTNATKQERLNWKIRLINPKGWNIISFCLLFGILDQVLVVFFPSIFVPWYFANLEHILNLRTLQVLNTAFAILLSVFTAG